MRWFIKGIEFRPDNADAIGFRADLTGNPEFAEISADRLIIKGDASEIITQHILTLGIFEGIPIRVEIDGYSLDYFIDLLADLTIKDSPAYPGIYEYECSIKRRKGKDDFADKAVASWRLINKTHPIPIFDVPFLIIRDNQAELLISLIIATYVLVKEAIEATKRLVEETAELIQVSVTDPVVGVGGGVVVKIGGIIKQALVVVGVLAYVVLLSFAIRALIEQILDIIFPKIRNLKGCKVRDLVLRGCQFAGYQLQSDLLNQLSGLTILPVTARPKQKSWWEQLQSNITEPYNIGYPTEQDSTPTFESVLDFIEATFNAETRVNNGVVKIETKEYFQLQANLTIDHNFNNQENIQNENQTNSIEAWKRYVLNYQKDSMDSFTYDDVAGSGVEFDTSPIVIEEPDLVSIKGLNRVLIPFAKGSRKNSLSFLETEARKIAVETDKILKTFGLDTNLTAKIDARKGVLQISQPFFAVSKLMWTVGGRQPANFNQIIGAKAIYDKYHITNEYKVNAKKIFQNMPVRFSPSDFIQLLENRYVFLEDGTRAEVLQFEYIPEDAQCTMNYAIPATYGDNTKVTLIFSE